jgi:hypothetical protein
MKSKRWLSFALSLVFMLLGCVDTLENPNTPAVYINFKIYPNSLHYQDLNTVSGWMYVTSESPSRGIIIYRMAENEFKAYDRMPPNDPDACCDAEGNCTRLVVDFPFVVDDCNDIVYNILDGSIVEGDGIFPLIEYHTSYDGSALRVYN